MSTLDTTAESPADIRPGTAIRDPLADHQEVEAITISFVRCPGAPYCGHLARVVAVGRRMRGALAQGTH
jgi:hypothetical protein